MNLAKATGSGVTTECPQEGVHDHPFRGPHRFTEWYEAAPLPSDTPADGLDAREFRFTTWDGSSLVVTVDDEDPGDIGEPRMVEDYDDATSYISVAALALTQEPRSTREEAE